MKTHGMSKTPEYKIWCKIKERCQNPMAINYNRYGAIGITICKQWNDDFSEFYKAMGKRPDGMTIDRIDNSKGYEPGNCRWATQTEQQNNRRNNVYVFYLGKTQTVVQWCRELGLVYQTIRARFLRGNWTPERALTTPINIKHRRKISCQVYQT